MDTTDQIEWSENKEPDFLEIPGILPVLPLRDIVIYPYMIFPVLVGREQSIKAASKAADGNKFIFLAAQKNSSIDDPDKSDIFFEGTIAKIVQILKLPNGLLKILVDGLVQGKIDSFLENSDFFEAKIEVVLPVIEEDNETEALKRNLDSLFKEYVKMNRNIPQEAINSFENFEEIDRKLYYAAANVNQSILNKQKILAALTFKEKYFELISGIKGEIDILKIEKEIDHKVHENITRTQRKFIIQEQIKILQEELGEDESLNDDSKLNERIEKAKMPKQVREKALEELNKLNKIPQLSPEYTVIRNYLDWLLNVPWYKKSKDHLEIGHVQKILDEDHFGLEKPKERIVEHIAVLNLVKQMKGQILCLVGPPGVGKTSLGKSIARALGREFVRISLGGVRDEAEIRGHRRTYIGALPGKIIQSMKRAGTLNPVILLDEIDKLSSDFRGDPSSAMLEVLDPEQNFSFNDHYLEVDYDLSQVLFITTANVRYNIPLPLQDRMEIIELSGYLEHDKVEIAKRHIVPKQCKLNGLENYGISFTDSALLKIVNQYTREAGVRNMEREITSVLRKIATEIVKSKAKTKKKSSGNIAIDENKVEELLGNPRFKKHKLSHDKRIGSVTGLAWTSVGGEILNVEVSVMQGKERLTLTGQLGNVMKESAQAGLSYIRSNAAKFGIDPEFFKSKEIHIHLPEGAIPKDGPSAGVTMIMAMISALASVPASGDVAMTGEITLRGDVLPIGGLTEKLLAAKRNAIKTVIIPKENEIDLREIRDAVKKDLNIVSVEKVDEIIPHLFPNWNQNSEKKGKNGKKLSDSGKTSGVLHS